MKRPNPKDYDNAEEYYSDYDNYVAWCDGYQDYLEERHREDRLEEKERNDD